MGGKTTSAYTLRRVWSRFNRFGSMIWTLRKVSIDLILFVFLLMFPGRYRQYLMRATAAAAAIA